MIQDPAVRRVLDGLLRLESLQVRQMVCREHLLKITLVRMAEPPFAVQVHGCTCSTGWAVERAVRENAWELYPEERGGESTGKSLA